MSHFGCVCVCGYSVVNRKWTGPLCYTLGVCVCGYSVVNRKWTGPLCHTLGVCVCGYSVVNIKWTGPLCHTLGVCVCGYSVVNIKWTGPLCHTLGVCVIPFCIWPDPVYFLQLDTADAHLYMGMYLTSHTNVKKTEKEERGRMTKASVEPEMCHTE